MRKECVILETLMRHNGEVVSRSRLAEPAWKDELVALGNLIDAQVGSLRRKVDAPGRAPLIRTVRGRGGRLDAPGSERG